MPPAGPTDRAAKCQSKSQALINMNLVLSLIPHAERNGKCKQRGRKSGEQIGFQKLFLFQSSQVLLDAESQKCGDGF